MAGGVQIGPGGVKLNSGGVVVAPDGEACCCTVGCPASDGCSTCCTRYTVTFAGDCSGTFDYDENFIYACGWSTADPGQPGLIDCSNGGGSSGTFDGWLMTIPLGSSLVHCIGVCNPLLLASLSGICPPDVGWTLDPGYTAACPGGVTVTVTKSGCPS